MRSVGVLVIFAGCALVVLGLLLLSGGLSWFGRLPGDIHFRGEHVQVYIPITSMLLVSIALSVLLYLIGRLLS